MRNAMIVAKRNNRLRPLKFDETTLRIDNARLRPFESLQGCIVNYPSERPSDILYRLESELSYAQDKHDTEKAIKIIKRKLRI